MNNMYGSWVKSLYDKHAQTIFKIAFYRLQDENDAKDAVQEVFLALLSKADQVYHHQNPDAWLMKALNYHILYVLNKRKHDNHSLIDLESAENLLSSQENGAASIDEILPTQLPDEDKKILKMYYEESLSYADISCALGIPVSTCGTRLRRAKQKLKHMLHLKQKGGDEHEQ